MAIDDIYHYYYDKKSTATINKFMWTPLHSVDVIV